MIGRRRSPRRSNRRARRTSSTVAGARRVKVGGFDLCFNFIIFLLVLTTLIVLGLFFFAFRKPKVVPGKFQMLMELGVQFVRENIAEPMLGTDAPGFMPLLAAFFFFILVGNMFEVFPGISFSANSRVAIRSCWRMVSWVTYNTVGIRQHGFFGYLRHTTIIPEAPAILRYGLLMPIEFISNIIVRPITLTVRLTANFVAGHFLLAIFFLGTVFFLEDGPDQHQREWNDIAAKAQVFGPSSRKKTVPRKRLPSRSCPATGWP